jgi:hypothetical protein
MKNVWPSSVFFKVFSLAAAVLASIEFRTCVTDCKYAPVAVAWACPLLVFCCCPRCHQGLEVPHLWLDGYDRMLLQTQKDCLPLRWDELDDILLVDKGCISLLVGVGRGVLGNATRVFAIIGVDDDGLVLARRVSTNLSLEVLGSKFVGISSQCG